MKTQCNPPKMKACCVCHFCLVRLFATPWMVPLEKEMATHSSVLAWRIPGTEEPGGLLSMRSHRVGHDGSDLAAAGWYPTRLLCPWDFPGKNTAVSCCALLQGIFLTQGSNPHLLPLLLWQVEKEMAIHSSTIAWKIPWTEEPGRLQSMGSQRVRHD